MSGHFRLLDLVVICVYFGGITVAGIYFARRSKDSEDYFLGGRNFPGWAIGLSLVGTSISSISFMAYPGDAYRTTWIRFFASFTLPIAVFIAARWFLQFYRRGKITSAYEYLEKRFGPRTRVYAALVFIVLQIARVGTVLFLLSLLLHEMTGLSTTWCILLGGVFVSFYTVAGGIEAVVWTDVVQTIVLVVGGLLCLLYIWAKLPGGLTEIVQVGWADGKFLAADASINSQIPFEGAQTKFSEVMTVEPVRWTPSLIHRTGFMLIFLGFLNWVFEYSCNQNVVQRYCASRSPREARKAMWVCCVSSVPIWTYFMFLGTALYVYYKHFPDENAFQILTGQGGKEAEQILPYFVLTTLPAGVSGLVVAAVLAAAMSSIDSSINAVSTVSIVDIYRRHFVTGKDERHYLRAARAIAIVSSVLMLVIAIWFDHIDKKTFQDTGIILASFMGGGLFGIYMLGFLTTWGDGRAVFLGILCTTSYTVWMGGGELGWWTVPGDAWYSVNNYYVGFVGHVIMFLVGFFGGGLISKLEGKRRPLTNLTVWTQDGTPLD